MVTLTEYDSKMIISIANCCEKHCNPLKKSFQNKAKPQIFDTIVFQFYQCDRERKNGLSKQPNATAALSERPPMAYFAGKSYITLYYSQFTETIVVVVSRILYYRNCKLGCIILSKKISFLIKRRFAHLIFLKKKKHFNCVILLYSSNSRKVINLL